MLLKSWPRRGSSKAREADSSGWSSERSAALTTGGAAWTSAWRYNATRVALHAAHSPSGPGVPPQAHLRCSRLVRTGWSRDIWDAEGFLLSLNVAVAAFISSL
jgi:hypothetical protein